MHKFVTLFFASFAAFLYAGFALLVPILLMLQFLVTFVTERSLRNSVGSTVTDYILVVLTPANIMWSIIPDGKPKIYYVFGGHSNIINFR
jgi:hypothetical protein